MILAPAASVPPGYALVRGLIRFLLALFYRRVAVVGAQHVPEHGGLVVAANHHNSIVDAMLLLAVLPRRLRTLANAPLFGHPFVGPFLRLLGALPVHRRQEAGNDPARNAALFAATTDTLRGGGAIAIFPEGRTQPEPVLLELRTGAARMLLAAAQEETPVALLPVGMVFHDPGTFREGEALVLIGPPVPTAEAVELARTKPARAGRELTEALATALRRLIVEADDRHTLRRLGLVEELWRAEGGEVPAGVSGRVEWMQRVMRTYRSLLGRDPARVAAFQDRLESLAAETERAGLRPDQLERHPTPGRLALRAAVQFLVLLAGFPLAMLGILLHVVPYELTGTVVRRMQRTDEEEATDKIAVGMVLFPFFWALELGGAWALGGPWAALLLLLALFPAGFFALAWRERLDRMQFEARAFLHCLRDRELPARLGAQQDALAAELRAMAAMVPEEWAE